MRNLFINKSGVAYPVDPILGLDQVTDLAIGAIGIFGDDGALLPGAAGTVNFSTEYLQIATKLSNGEIKMSGRIYRGVNHYDLNYVAPVAPKKSLGSCGGSSAVLGSLNLPTTFVVGSNVSFSIRDLSKESFDETGLEIYSFPVSAGDDAASIIVKAVAAVNNNIVSCVTAVGVTDGILFTAKVAGNDFAPMIMSGVFQDADILEYHIKNGKLDDNIVDDTVAFVRGQGTPEQIAEAEKLASINSDGNTNTQLLSKHMWNVPSMVEATNYDQVNFTYVVGKSDRIMRENNPLQYFSSVGESEDAPTSATTINDGFVAVRAILLAWANLDTSYTITYTA